MRLNKEIRGGIVENAYKTSTIPSEKKALTARSVALAEKVRIASMEPGLDDRLKEAEAEIKYILKKRGIPQSHHPSRIFDRNNQIGAKLAGGQVWLSFDGGIVERREVTLVERDYEVNTRRFVEDHYVEYDEGHEFTIEYRDIISRAKELRERERVLRNTVKATVEAFNTIEKLVEQWPESEALIPKETIAASKPMPLAIQVDTLNQLIGLPK